MAPYVNLTLPPSDNVDSSFHRIYISRIAELEYCPPHYTDNILKKSLLVFRHIKKKALLLEKECVPGILQKCSITMLKVLKMTFSKLVK